MAKKKKAFRFRFPWFSEASAPRPAARPKEESKSREQADASVPIQGSSGKAPAPSPPTQAQEVPIDQHGQHSPSHSHQPDKTYSITIESPGHSLSKPESLPSVSSFPISETPAASQPPVHSALEPTAVGSTSQATSPPQQAKQETVVSEPMPQPERSPLKPIPKSQEAAEPKTSPQLSESVPQPKATSPPQQAKEEMIASEPVPQPEMSPLRTIPKSQEVAEPKISPQLSELAPQPKDSPLKSIPKSQKLTQPESSPHAFEPMPQPKESPLKTMPRSPKITQPKISSHVTEQVPQSKDSPLKPIPKSQELTQPESSPHVLPQPKDSQLKSISKFQEPTQLETSSHVSEPVPQLKESPLETILKSQDLTQPKTSSPMSKPLPQPKESPSIALPKSPKSPPKKKFEFDSNREDTKSVLEAQSKFHQNEENEKVVHELTEETKAQDAMARQTEAELHTRASVSGTQTQDSVSQAFRADWKKQDVGESIERKLMFAASNSSGKDIKVVSSVDPMAKSKPNNSHQMDVLSNREKTLLKKGIREDILKFVQELKVWQPTDPMEDKPVHAITLAGENRGATMQIGSKKERSVHIHRAYKTDPEESQEVTTDAEEGSNNSVEQDDVGKGYVNSNIQSINNSLMHHGSITEKDPGVQLVLPQKPA